MSDVLKNVVGEPVDVHSRDDFEESVTKATATWAAYRQRLI
jgi:hypothetical protein